MPKWPVYTHLWWVPFHCRTLETMCKQFQKAKEKCWAEPNHNHCNHNIHIIDTQRCPSTPEQNVVTATPRATLLQMPETVTIVARKDTSVACVEDWEYSPPKGWTAPSMPERSIKGQDHTAKPGTTVVQRTGQTVEDTVAGVLETIFSDRSASGDCYRAPSRDCYRSSSRSNRHSSIPYHKMFYHQDSLNTLQINSLETAHIPKDGTLTVDIVQDGQTMILTILHFKTNSSKITAQVKIDKGAEAGTLLLIHFKMMFPHKINSHKSR